MLKFRIAETVLKLPVIGQQQQPLAILIQPTHGVNAWN
jgi:hypothetical protein